MPPRPASQKSMAKDYYQILGVERNASDDDIKRAFRKLAHQYHPDKGGDQEKFKEINEAYQVVGNPEKRKQYDQYGQTFENMGGQGGFGFDPFGGQGGFNVNFEDLGGFGDIFSQFFGGETGRGRGRTRGRNRGSDLQVELTIDFKEMVHGAKRDLSLNRLRKCEHCKGNLAEPGTKIVECKTCAGRGFVRKQTSTILGTIMQEVVCAECHGEGKKAEVPCKECHGEGRTRKVETLVVKIPAGIEDGMRIRISGEGEAAQFGGDVGDLYVSVKVREDKRFVRDGFDLRSTHKIPFVTAVLGGEIQVETVDGKEKLEIPKGAQSGTELRLKSMGVGQGLQGNDNKRGDHIVKIEIAVPKKISKKQEQLLREFETAEGKKVLGFF